MFSLVDEMYYLFLELLIEALEGNLFFDVNRFILNEKEHGQDLGGC